MCLWVLEVSEQSGWDEFSSDVIEVDAVCGCGFAGECVARTAVEFGRERRTGFVRGAGRIKGWCFAGQGREIGGDGVCFVFIVVPVKQCGHAGWAVAGRV